MNNFIFNASATGDWRQIENFPNYLISRNGEIISFYLLKDGSYRISQMKISEGQNGYHMVCLRNNDKKLKRVAQVGRLVLETFCPTENMEELDCDHIDKNRGNNNLDNLRWLSHKENVSRRNKKKPYRRNAPIVVQLIDGEVKRYNSRLELIDDINITQWTLTHILSSNSKYKNSSNKYCIASAYYEDMLTDEIKKQIGYNNE